MFVVDEAKTKRTFRRWKPWMNGEPPSVFLPGLALECSELDSETISKVAAQNAARVETEVFRPNSGRADSC